MADCTIREQLKTTANVSESEALLFEPVIAKAVAAGASLVGLLDLVSKYGAAAIKVIQFVIEYGTIAIEIIKKVLALFPAEIPTPAPVPSLPAPGEPQSPFGE